MVSIIVPVYNTEKYIEECIQSLLVQSYKDIEVILIDDGSTDGSLKICETYAKKYANVSCYSQKNTGVSAARNLGLLKSNGKYIMFLDADDTVDKNVVKNLVRNFKEGELMSVRSKKVDGKAEKELKRKSIYYVSGIVEDIMLDRIQGFVWGYLFEKDKIVEFKEDIKYCEDVLFLLEYISKNKIKKLVFLDGMNGYHYYRDNKDSVTNSKKNMTGKLNDFMAAMNVLKKVTNGVNDNIINNREIIFCEAEMQHMNRKDIEKAVATIELPNHHGLPLRFRVFWNLCRKKNVNGLICYYALRNIVKTLVNNGGE